MKNSMLILGLVATTAALVGCGGNKVDQLYEKIESVQAKGCECEDITMMTMAMCIAAAEADLPTAAERECIRGVYDRHSAELDGPLDCVIDAADAFGNCVDDAACNAAALQSCFERYDAVSSTCDEPSADIQAEITACNM